MGCAAPDATDEQAGAALTQELERLNTRLGVPRLRDIKSIDQGRYEAMLDKMATDALASGSPQNNPVVPTASDIIALYRQAW